MSSEPDKHNEHSDALNVEGPNVSEVVGGMSAGAENPLDYLHKPRLGEGSEIRYQMSDDGDWKLVTILGRAGKALGQYSSTRSGIM